MAVAAPNITITSPLVYVERSADRETTELAAKLIEQRLKTVLIESTSSAAPTKRIRILRRRYKTKRQAALSLRGKLLC